MSFPFWFIASLFWFIKSLIYSYRVSNSLSWCWISSSFDSSWSCWSSASFCILSIFIWFKLLTLLELSSSCFKIATNSVKLWFSSNILSFWSLRSWLLICCYSSSFLSWIIFFSRSSKMAALLLGLFFNSAWSWAISVSFLRIMVFKFCWFWIWTCCSYCNWVTFEPYFFANPMILSCSYFSRCAASSRSCLICCSYCWISLSLSSMALLFAPWISFSISSWSCSFCSLKLSSFFKSLIYWSNIFETPWTLASMICSCSLLSSTWLSYSSLIWFLAWSYWIWRFLSFLRESIFAPFCFLVYSIKN